MPDNSPRNACLRCGMPLNSDTISTHGDDSPPLPGDFALCANCCKLHRFDDELRFRGATEDECDALLDSPMGDMVRKVVLARKEYLDSVPLRTKSMPLDDAAIHAEVSKTVDRGGNQADAHVKFTLTKASGETETWDTILIFDFDSGAVGVMAKSMPTPEQIQAIQASIPDLRDGVGEICGYGPPRRPVTRN